MNAIERRIHKRNKMFYRAILFALLLLGIIGLAGCDTPVTALQGVQETYTNSVVMPIPYQQYRFLTQEPDGAVYWIQWDESGGKVNNRLKIFHALPSTKGAAIE